MRQAVEGSPSTTLAGRSSGRYSLTAPYDVALALMPPSWSATVRVSSPAAGNRGRRASVLVDAERLQARGSVYRRCTGSIPIAPPTAGRMGQRQDGVVGQRPVERARVMAAL